MIKNFRDRVIFVIVMSPLFALCVYGASRESPSLGPLTYQQAFATAVGGGLIWLFMPLLIVGIVEVIRHFCRKCTGCEE